MKASAVGSAEAAALHARLDLNPDLPVDVFGIAQGLRIWLRPGDLPSGEYGFYLRDDRAPGIFLSSRHPETTQRFTCAHELGHHLLGHESHVDGAEIFGRTTDPQEVAAQSFAANFLMPYVSLRRALKRVGVVDPKRDIGAQQVYLAAQRLDVSYLALLWQVRANGWIGSRSVNALRKQSVLPSVKRGLAPEGITVPSSPVADVRPVTLANDAALWCREGDDVLVSLPEASSTGYRWAVESTNETIELRGDGYVPRGPVEQFGVGAVERVFHLRPTVADQLAVRFVYRRPWESAESPITRVLTLETGPRHSIELVAADQMRRHAERFAA